MDAQLCQQGTHPPHHGESHYLCFNYIPFQTLNHPPSTMDGLHCLAMLMPRLFNLWLSSCPSLHSQGGARTLVKCWAVTFITLLQPPGQQWKSLWSLSIQIKIQVANDEKLKGYHWIKPKCYNMASLALK